MSHVYPTSLRKKSYFYGGVVGVVLIASGRIDCYWFFLPKSHLRSCPWNTAQAILAESPELLHAGPATHRTAAARANGGAALCSLCNW